MNQYRCHECRTPDSAFCSGDMCDKCYQEKRILPNKTKQISTPPCRNCSRFDDVQYCYVQCQCGHFVLYLLCLGCRLTAGMTLRFINNILVYCVQNLTLDCKNCDPSLWRNRPCSNCPVRLYPAERELKCCETMSSGFWVCKKCLDLSKPLLICPECFFIK